MDLLQKIPVAGRAVRSLQSRWKSASTKRRASRKEQYRKDQNLGRPKAVIWIFGCQRSGTTLLERILRHDMRSAVFGEFSALTIGERRTVLAELEEVKSKILDENACYAAVRPLFESDRAPELLDLFSTAAGIWLFRDVNHVVDSMIRKWDDRFFDISREVETGLDGDWRLHSLAQELQAMIDERPGDRSAIAEAYGRYWIARNRIPWELGLNEDPRCMFLEYGQLASKPEQVVEKVLSSVGEMRWPDFKTDANTASVHRPVPTILSPSTQTEADELLAMLRAHAEREFGVMTG